MKKIYLLIPIILIGLGTIFFSQHNHVYPFFLIATGIVQLYLVKTDQPTEQTDSKFRKSIDFLDTLEGVLLILIGFVWILTLFF
ncbi:hypothetical protein [Vagococcus hydrophili]|uniref:Uncharacterized protein n=1 Tax=Vagococcus hydrophili TaxID=2714947 RepID=A0A6G8AWV6_9ENTE|nr:hypothetical protein [Vagococcus hydrophili]QIL49581.1 hypothetical protein G7082_14265 [Vagococcus hydrophili]